MKKINVITAAIFLAATLAGCGNDTGSSSSDTPSNDTVSGNTQNYLDVIRTRGKLIVGVFSDNPPFGFVNDQGQYVGFDTDIGKRFAKDLLGDESKIEFVTIDPMSRIPLLQTNKVDLIIANMTVTEDRAKAVDFTNPNLRVGVQAIVKNGNNANSLDDLDNQTVIVQSGTTADVWLTANRPSWRLLKFEKNSEALQALSNGRGDAYVQDNLVLFTWSKNHPGYRILPQKIGDDAPIAPAVKKGNTVLREWVNEELVKLGKEQYLLKLYNQYVRSELVEGTRPDDVIVEGGQWK